MSRRTIKPEEMALLRKALESQRPDLLPLLDLLGVELLTAKQRDDLQDALLDESLATGYEAGWIPNQRGLRLEDLIGVIGRFSEDG